MSTALKQFIGGAIFLIALFLALTHAGGLSRAIGSGAQGTAGIVKSLQGR
jgi:hypothetical protein